MTAEPAVNPATTAPLPSGLDLFAFPTEAIAGMEFDPFTLLPFAGPINKRVRLLASMWTDEQKYERIVMAGRYFQLCNVTQLLFDCLARRRNAIQADSSEGDVALPQDRPFDFADAS